MIAWNLKIYKNDCANVKVHNVSTGFQIMRWRSCDSDLQKNETLLQKANHS